MILESRIIDEVVSPVKHETRTIHSTDGDITIDSYSKHLRTTSKCDLFEKTTKVRKTSHVGDLDIVEEDKIITREKVHHAQEIDFDSVCACFLTFATCQKTKSLNCLFEILFTHLATLFNRYLRLRLVGVVVIRLNVNTCIPFPAHILNYQNI